MSGHDMSLNVRVSLLTAQILEYWNIGHSRLARPKSRKPAVYVPQVRGSVLRSFSSSSQASSAPSSIKSTKSKRSLCFQEKAAATCLVQNLSVLSTNHDAPAWLPDQTEDWALIGEDSPRCSFDSHISFDIELPSNYIHLSDLMADREVDKSRA